MKNSFTHCYGVELIVDHDELLNISPDSMIIYNIFHSDQNLVQLPLGSGKKVIS